MHRALGVILMRLRIAEVGENTVAHVTSHETLVSLDACLPGVLTGTDHLAQVLGIKPQG